MVAIDRARRGRPALWPAGRTRSRRDQAQRAVAHRRNRIFHQLFAAAGPAGHHHAERPVLRALSCGTAGRRSGSAPADDPWPGRASAASFDEGHRAFSVGVAHPFHRMPGQWRHGMARRAAEFAAVQPRHDLLRGMDRGAAFDPAGRSRGQEGSEVGDGRGRRRRAHEPQPAARQMSRRLPRGLRAERRGAAARAGLSAAAGGAGLGRQCQHQVAAPDQARRQTLAFPRGNLEIHRPDAGRHRARLHLADRRQVGHHLPLPGKAARWPRPLRNPRPGMDRQRQGQAGRRLRGWRRQLADRAAARAGAVEGADEIHAALALGRQARRCWNPASSTRPATCSRRSRNCESSAE